MRAFRFVTATEVTVKNPMPAIAGIAFALFAPLAFAQAGKPPMNEQEQVQREEQEMQNRANEHAMTPKRTEEPKAFEQLDRNKVGYLTLDDARRDKWLSEHFAQCDLDRNNQVSRDEYATCTERRD